MHLCTLVCFFTFYLLLSQRMTDCIDFVFSAHQSCLTVFYVSAVLHFSVDLFFIQRVFKTCVLAFEAVAAFPIWFLITCHICKKGWISGIFWYGGPNVSVFDKLGLTHTQKNWWSEMDQIHQKVYCYGFKNTFKILVWDNVSIRIKNKNILYKLILSHFR